MVLENIPISDVGERDPEVGKRGNLGYCNTTATRVVGWAPSETLEGVRFNGCRFGTVRMGYEKPSE